MTAAWRVDDEEGEECWRGGGMMQGGCHRPGTARCEKRSGAALVRGVPVRLRNEMEKAEKGSWIRVLLMLGLVGCSGLPPTHHPLYVRLIAYMPLKFYQF